MRMALIVVLALAGCGNDCQKLCVDMAKYAEDSCGLEFSKDEVRQCKDDFASGNLPKESRKNQKEYCDEVRDSLELENEWSCEDLEVYFSGSSSSSDDSGE